MFEINKFTTCKTSQIIVEPFKTFLKRTKLCPITTYKLKLTTFLPVDSILGFFKLFNPDHPFPLFIPFFSTYSILVFIDGLVHHRPISFIHKYIHGFHTYIHSWISYLYSFIAFILIFIHSFHTYIHS